MKKNLFVASILLATALLGISFVSGCAGGSSGAVTTFYGAGR